MFSICEAAIRDWRKRMRKIIDNFEDNFRKVAKYLVLWSWTMTVFIHLSSNGRLQSKCGFNRPKSYLQFVCIIQCLQNREIVLLFSWEEGCKGNFSRPNLKTLWAERKCQKLNFIDGTTGSEEAKTNFGTHSWDPKLQWAIFCHCTFDWWTLCSYHFFNWHLKASDLIPINERVKSFSYIMT